MKALFTTILLMISFLTFSQSSYQFSDSTKQWNTMYYGLGTFGILHCEGTYSNKISGETILNDTTFFNIYEAQDSLQQNWDQIGYLREDTVNKKVFFSTIEGEAGLIYDFDLLVGDSVMIDNFFLGFENILLVCDSINTFSMNGSSKSRFFLHSPGSWGSDIWIEGIGSRFGILNSGYNGTDITGGGRSLLCCTKNDTLVFMDSVFNSCYMQEFYPKIASEFYDTAYLNTYYEFKVQISDTNNIDSFALKGLVIPEYFEFNVTTGLLTGLPCTSGSFPCIITITNNDLGFSTDMLYSNINVVLPTTEKEIPKQEEIKIHPNPFSSGFYISFDKMADNHYYLEIFNSEGILVTKKAISETNYRVDCSNFENGIFLLKITDLNQKILTIKKIIKK